MIISKKYERLRELNIDRTAQNGNCCIGGHGGHDLGDLCTASFSRGTQITPIMPNHAHLQN